MIYIWLITSIILIPVYVKLIKKNKKQISILEEAQKILKGE